MMYKIIYAQEALDGINNQVTHYVSESVPVDTINAWFQGLIDQVAGLYSMPRRFPVAQSVTKVKGYEMRRMNYGVYAVYYRVDDDQKMVEIVAFRHGRQQPWLEGESS
ncbi:MAG: type II toxin-antitoxin system RelE/ParE family toxin [Phycisphaerales bacterium]|nr:type II toxin-antitoxin system RelE/ParE family toxin [Phycisphaerales bacterium]